MSNYKRLYPKLEKGNTYIANLIYDKEFENVLYDGISLKNMKSPNATLKNLSGKSLDFLYALGGKLIVSEKVKLFLEKTYDCSYFEFIEVNFENKKMKPYYVLNILELVDAFDWEKSEYELFEELGPKGNKVIQNIIKMEIDESKTNNRKLFNLLNFEGSIIIHIDLVNQMLNHGITGTLIDPLIGQK
ncbi:hypothetical protein FIA58_015575 [Flavobacterium jejuense]|uniref:Immunity MXAN-0049 protein domain-containing protein n=1 Tax=Flavobacterium jejuense TaxID=1544455 RepID=A0ABX0IX44_9FLAO|nr:DUF1629 domain-containing protein [Flavobacterium jejuense]NHN27103.1 hypothetical protein [Flavobacterium jejuense]